MLSALAVGLAAGVGLYALGVFSTAFLVVLLGIIESFEKSVKKFELTVKVGDRTDELRGEDRDRSAALQAAPRAAHFG